MKLMYDMPIFQYNFVIFSLIFSVHIKAELTINAVLSSKPLAPIAIIGAGPAGLPAAAICARMLQASSVTKPHTSLVYVFTGGNTGGHLNDISRIENFPGQPAMPGVDLAHSLQEQAKSFGAILVPSRVVSVDFSQWPYKIGTHLGETISAMAVIIATGFTPEKPNIPGVQECWGKGVGICSVCDAPFHKGHTVVVAGSDDYAADKVMQLAWYASQVVLVVTGTLRMSAKVLNDLKKLTNLRIIQGSSITQVQCSQDKVEGVIVRNDILGGQETISAQGVFVDSKYVPNSQMFDQFMKIDDEGYITLHQKSQQVVALDGSPLAGVYAAGVVTRESEGKAGISAGDGMRAALKANEFLVNSVGFNHETVAQLENNLFQVVPQDDAQSLPEVVSKEEFEQARQQAHATHQKLFIVYFYSPTCPVCKEMMPLVQQLAKRYEKEIDIIKVNAKNAKSLVEEFNVTGIPTAIILKADDTREELRGKQQIHDKLQTIVEVGVQNLPTSTAVDTAYTVVDVS